MFVFSFKFGVLCSGVLRFGVSLALHCPYVGCHPERLNPEPWTWNPNSWTRTRNMERGTRNC